MANETFTTITTTIATNVLISVGVVISSLVFLKVKSLFKPSVLEPEVVSSSLYVPRGTNSLSFICENYQSVDFALFKPYYLTVCLRPHAYLNYNGTVSVLQPTLKNGNTTLFFENIKEFTEIYSVKVNAFIQLVDVFTIYGKIPFCVMVFLSVYKHCIPYNFVSLCGKFILKTLLSLKKVS